ncbi:MAG: hypothetical protein U0R70_06265 [Solirubrobacteraceae bacterium]
MGEDVGLVMGGLLVAFVGFVVLLGLFHPRSTAQTLDWKPTRSPELEAQNEVDDLAQMLDATNDRRRRRGERELTIEQVELRVAAERGEQRSREDDYLAAEDVAQMLAVKNERRRRRGLPDLTEAEFRASLESTQARLAAGRPSPPPA